MIFKYNRHIKSFLRLAKCRMLNKKLPLFTALGVTNRCNYRCVYCYGDYYHQKKENFSTDELLKVIDALEPMGTCILNLIGGEPLIRDDIHHLIKRTKQRKMICHVSTNASLLEEKIDLVLNVDAIDTSLDGLEENNDKNRGNGTFRKTLTGIKCAVANGIKTNVNMVLTKYNLNDLEPMLELAVSEGFTLSFNIVFESHSSLHTNYEDSLYIKSKDDAMLRGAIKKIVSYKEKGYPVRFSKSAYRYALNWPRPYSERVYIHDNENTGDFKTIPCYFSHFHCYIDTDGRMYNCMHIKDSIPDVNIREHGVEESWQKISSCLPPCKACYTICNNDANLVFGLRPGTLFSTIKDMMF